MGSIQPVLDLAALQHAYELLDSDLHQIKIWNLNLLGRLRQGLEPVVVKDFKEKIPENLSDDEIILWFIGSEKEIEYITALKTEQKEKIVLFNVDLQNPLAVLKKTQCAGLVTSTAVDGWLSAKDKSFFKLGVGQGLYGYKKLFDQNIFDPTFLEIQASETYCIFYKYEIHDLNKLLLMYVIRLFSTLDGSNQALTAQTD